MDIVVGGVSGGYEADGRDMQTGRVVGISVPEGGCDKVVAFEIDHMSLELVGDHEAPWDLTRIARVPESRDELRRGLLAHDGHHSGCCDGSGTGETLPERSDAKEVVPVAVRDIDRGQVLTARRDPLHQRVCLLAGEKVVDEDGIPLAIDQGR